MDKFFKISERGSNVRTEIVGGIVTFFSMAYIIFVNPNYLSAAGMNWHAVMLATCISAAIAMGLEANDLKLITSVLFLAILATFARQRKKVKGHA